MSRVASSALARRPPARVPVWAVAAVFWSGVAAIVAARAAGVADVPAVTTLGVIFTSIVVEALPFILVGAVVSAAIEVFVPGRALERIARLPRRLQLPGAALAGAGFPLCECGSVPVGRRLIARGVDPGAGVAFMLAAPILNPLVLASTWVAYDGRGRALEMTAARAALGVAIATLVGWVVGRAGSGELLRPDHGEVQHEHHDHVSGPGRRARSFSECLTGDFFFMGKFLILGAAAAAVLQTVLPQEVISGIGGSPVLAALTMMGIAFALSLCSEADAFVAASFTAFPLGSQLAFLVTGPMIDTKLAVLYGATFKRRLLSTLVLTAVPVALAGSILFDALT